MWIAWSELGQITLDGLRVWEALRRASVLTAEGERVRALAEELLRRAGLAYLTEGLEPLTLPPPEAPGAAALAIAWADVLQAHADLKQALYRLAQAQVEAGEWEAAQASLEALRPWYQEDAALARWSEQVATALEREAHLYLALEARLSGAVGQVAEFRHDNTVRSVAFSPDGRLLASGNWDKTVKVWGPV